MPFRNFSDPTPQLSAEHLSTEDIVVISLSDWDGPKRIRQFISEALVRRKNRVLFVEAQYTLSKFLKGPNLRRLFGFLKGPRLIQKDLFLLSAPFFIPGSEFSPLLARVNWYFTRPVIQRAMRRLGFKRPTLLVFAFSAFPLIGELNEHLAIYFCNDAFQLLAPKMLKGRVLELERRLLTKVDAVFTVSDKLSQEKSVRHSRVRTVYHGVDIEAFDSPEFAPVPSDIPPNRPIIGYSGVIRDMIDIGLLEFVATQRPDWSLVLVGPRAQSSRQFKSGLDRLDRLGNVFFLGPKPVASIPAYIRVFNLCMIPYVQTEVSTYYSAPLKFFEYLAAGKRVISTVGPRFLDEDFVINCGSPQEFLDAIDSALRSDNENLMQKRKDVARQNSWDARIQEMATFLEATKSLR